MVSSSGNSAFQITNPVCRASVVMALYICHTDHEKCSSTMGLRKLKPTHNNTCASLRTWAFRLHCSCSNNETYTNLRETCCDLNHMPVGHDLNIQPPTQTYAERDSACKTNLPSLPDARLTLVCGVFMQSPTSRFLARLTCRTDGRGLVACALLHTNQ